MDYLQFDELPELRRPTLLAAFRGWSDAGEAATLAIRHLIEGWSAQEFARIDPEEFYDFTVARPVIRITEEGQRDLEWPANTFYGYRREDADEDVVLFLGTEPHLKWRAFTSEIRELFERLGGARLVTVGSLVGATTHTRPAPITGFATEEELRRRLEAMTVTRTRYQGPTGIVGALHDAFRRADHAAASVWVALAPYLGNSTNPRGALTLLETLDHLFAFAPNLAMLARASQQFEKQVDEALESNPEMRQYLEEMEKRIDSGISEASAPDIGPPGDLIGELESYLRQQRREG